MKAGESSFAIGTLRRDCPSCWSLESLKGSMGNGEIVCCACCGARFRVDTTGYIERLTKAGAPLLLRVLLITLTLIAIAAAMGLTGCASMGEPDDWSERPTHESLPAVFVEIAVADLPRTCGNYPGLTLHGCAKRDYVSRVCVIYTGPNPQPWLRTHELTHCAGYDHAAPRAMQTALR
jgi:hypothetical protein